MKIRHCCLKGHNYESDGAYCRSPMKFENKGPLPKGGTFLVCEASKRGMGCVTTGWRYEQFESSFLAFVEQLDLPNILRNDDSVKKALDDAVQALQGRHLALKAEMESAYGLLKINPNIQFVADKLAGLEQQLKDLEAHIAEEKSERQKLEASDTAFYESKDEIKALVASLQTPGDNDLYKLRSQLAAGIKTLIAEFNVAPLGEAPIVDALLKEEEGAGREALKSMFGDQRDNRRYFLAAFKDNTALRVYPRRDDPFKVDANEASAGRQHFFGWNPPL
jgi:hypothetical protein